MTKFFKEIDGLKLEPNWRINNGEESFVVPFPTTAPFNLVFHGETEFEYGHYGIHLGQEDRLTFLGNPDQIITAFFIDCRENSPTKGNRLTQEFNASSEFCLCIPPGVAHAFNGLENVFTINSYRLFLPEPDKWVAGETKWTIENDVINLPMDVKNDDIVYFEPNICEASEVFYELIREHQIENLPKIDSEYPFTEDFKFEDGTNARVMFRKKQNQEKIIPDWEEIEGIEGLGWEKHLSYWSGDSSGFVPFLDHSPFYVVDHGTDSYSHDAYGIHIGQEDRLTFVGDSTRLVTLELVDCREGTSTKHNKVKIEFYPSALRFLVIPNGVAHRFENLHNVFTINRPRIYSDNINEYEPGNDVIDWDVKDYDYPTFAVSSKEANLEYYRNQAESQKTLMMEPAKQSTPIVVSVKDENENLVKVAIRKNDN